MDTPLAEPQRGLAWHVHHDKLIEYCYDIEERRAHMRDTKPIKEQAIRLARLQFVQRPLGSAQAVQAYKQAVQVCEQAVQAYKQAVQVCEQAVQELEQAVQAYKQAWVNSLAPGELEAAHHEECPDCPWDGTTLFPQVRE